MHKFEVELALDAVAKARAEWAAANLKFRSNVDFVMTRLIYEAAVNRMSAQQVSKHAGLSVSQVRHLMRKNGLFEKTGKMLLSEQAAAALASNAALMGVEPHEMDLTSPLAYLPMGSELRKKFLETQISQVTEVDTPPTAKEVLDYFADHPEDLSDIPRRGSEDLLDGWTAYVARYA